MYFNWIDHDTVDVAHYDTHLHWRRLPIKEHLLTTTALRVSGASEEPNTKPHLQTYDDVARSVEECYSVAPGRVWKSSIYLTPDTKSSDVIRAWEAGLITHVKRYPPHGSTHSDESVSDHVLLDQESPTGRLLRDMSERRIPYKSHGEVVEWNGEELDPFDREEVYFREVQPRIDETYPDLRQIHAHISTAQAADYMRQHGDPTKKIAEITGHHGMKDRRITFDGGAYIVDHHCLPPVKRLQHRDALRDLLAEKPAYLVAGSDAAAHTVESKYQCCAFGGFYTYHCSLELYLQLLAQRFFGSLLPKNPHRIRVQRKMWQVTDRIKSADGAHVFTPFGFHPNKERRHQFTWPTV